MTRNLISHFVLGGIAATALCVASAQAQHAGHADPPASAAAPKVSEAAAAQRDLWVGHIFWVRTVVVATLAGNEAATAAADQEVVGNARAIAGSIEPFYGKEASEKLFALLAGHYGAVKQVLAATASGSQSDHAAAVKELTRNAADIAKFLSSANPNLPFETLNGLLAAHGGHHIQQIQQLHDRKYAEEAETWEAMKTHMYGIADALTGAIAKQFPASFS